MASPTLYVDVLGYPHVCRRCGVRQDWVWAVQARAIPRDGFREAFATDQEYPVQIARDLLIAAGYPDRAALLGQRRERGRSFNPNICGSCRHQEDWYSFEGVLTAGYHEVRHAIASATCPVARWRELVDLARDNGAHWV
ncbi:hypothetical protein ACWDO0_30660 [Nocardia rhamnosiphila]